jgi:putative acetyltransferase
MLEVWEGSVRATHHFLADGDIVELRPLVAAGFASNEVDWWLLVSASEVVIGFLGYTSGTIEALFIDADHQGRGGGTFLVAHAQGLGGGALAVDVNEQNEAALRFYERLGFEVVRWSPTDAAGRPFPLLHLMREALG